MIGLAPHYFANADGVARVSVAALIALRHDAESLPWRVGAIRAARGGAYLSPFKGRGMEFDEVRPYQQGDDARTLDWRVTARTGRPHTKLFREERERAVLLWVDLRRAMHFATRGAFKAVRAAQAAALLGWSAVRHGDRLGGLFFAEGFHRELTPGRGSTSLLRFLEQLAGAPAWISPTQTQSPSDPESTLMDALTRIRRVARPGGLIFLLSDFQAINAITESHLIQLARHSDLVLIQIYDPLEAELPPPGHYRISDGRAVLAFDTDSDAMRHHYREVFTTRCLALTMLCRNHGIHHFSLATDDEPLTALQRGLGIH